jgi:cytosine/creatinine deaminase
VVSEDKGYLAALEEAHAGSREGGIPIGSSLVRKGAVIGRGHNLRVQSSDPTAHAEIACLRNAGRQRSYADTALYTTLAPCHLCTGAVLLFGIPRVVVGEMHTFDGEGSLLLLRDRGVEVEIIDDPEARTLLSDFIVRNPDVWDEDIGH